MTKNKWIIRSGNAGYWVEDCEGNKVVYGNLPDKKFGPIPEYNHAVIIQKAPDMVEILKVVDEYLSNLLYGLVSEVETLRLKMDVQTCLHMVGATTADVSGSYKVEDKNHMGNNFSEDSGIEVIKSAIRNWICRHPIEDSKGNIRSTELCENCEKTLKDLKDSINCK